MKIWAVANQKGGVGKTTTAVSLAGILATQNKNVLIIDLDPHGSVTAYFGYDPDFIEDSSYKLFGTKFSEKLIKSIIVDTKVEKVKLLPASPALATLDRQLGAFEGKGLVLKKSLVNVEQDFDYVLIDCPPLLGVLMINALAACEKLLIPVQTEFLALKGLERMVTTIKMVMQAQKHQLPNLIIPTMFDRRTRSSVQMLRTLRENYGAEVWPSVIPVDTKFRDASQQGLPLSMLYPSSRGSAAYKQLLHYLSAEDKELSNMAQSNGIS